MLLFLLLSPLLGTTQALAQTRSDKRMTSPPTQKRPPGKALGWWQNGYLLDWGIALVLGGGGLVLSHLVPPVEREWSAADQSLAFPTKETMLPHPVPLLMAYGIPMLGFALAQIGAPAPGRSRGHDFHHAALGLTESLGLTLAVSGMLQVISGKLRPDWRSRCKPDIESLGCTGDASAIDQGRRSFPNQSTAFAFAGGTFLTLYLLGKLKLFDGNGAIWKFPIVIAPLTAATLFAVVRANEHRAHAEDVLIGALIGIASASIGYALNFNSPFHSRAGIPRLRVSIAPIVTPTQAGLALRGRW